MSFDQELHEILEEEQEKRKNPPFRLHGGVRGAHPSMGGQETPPADIAADDTRFGGDARFTQGPGGRDSMDAGQLQLSGPKQHADTAPWRTRPQAQGDQLGLPSDDPAFRPTDVAQHVVRLKHPHLGNDYALEHSGDDHGGHQVTAYHQNEEVGFLRWNGKREVRPMDSDDGMAPGEIQGVSVHPDHRGKELSTAMWDYAQVKVAQHGIQHPVHSKDRSTAGNHWAHFVGGASLARTEGHHADEYFKGEWR